MVWDANLWMAVGFLGQAIFTARFLVQWLASERKRGSRQKKSASEPTMIVPR